MRRMTAEHRDATARAVAFVDEVCRPLEADWAPADYDVDPDVVMHVARRFREYGLRGLSVPSEAGGQGAGTVAKCLVCEEIASSHVVHGSLATWSGLMEPAPMLYHAPQWQKEKYLTPLLREDKFCQLNISEPGAGSDAAGITTTAVRRANGYVINGTKRWSPPPHHPAVTPEYLLCFAVTEPGPGHRSISAFLVDYPNPGVSVERIIDTAGTSYQGLACDYRYEDCIVLAENLLGSAGQGFRYMMDQLNRNRVVIGASLLGRSAWAQRKAIAFARERSAFGRPLSGRQAIQWMIADSEMELAQLRLLTYETCLAPLVGAKVTDRAMQIHGGSE